MEWHGDGSCCHHRSANLPGRTTLPLRFGMPSFSGSLGWHRISLSLEAPASSQCGPPVFEPYSLRGAEGVALCLSARVSCRQFAHKAECLISLLPLPARESRTSKRPAPAPGPQSVKKSLLPYEPLVNSANSCRQLAVPLTSAASFVKAPWEARSSSSLRLRGGRRQRQPVFDPVPVLGEQRNRQVQRFDLSSHTRNCPFSVLQNRVHIPHDPPSVSAVPAFNRQGRNCSPTWETHAFETDTLKPWFLADRSMATTRAHKPTFRGD